MDSRQLASLIRKAIGGDHNAIESVLEQYKPLIYNSSIVDGVFDEDCKQCIMIRIAIDIRKFQD